jgi:hypothetical protein
MTGTSNVFLFVKYSKKDVLLSMFIGHRDDQKAGDHE